VGFAVAGKKKKKKTEQKKVKKLLYRIVEFQNANKQKRKCNRR
jgi:hypothetical protein